MLLNCSRKPHQPETNLRRTSPHLNQKVSQYPFPKPALSTRSFAHVARQPLIGKPKSCAAQSQCRLPNYVAQTQRRSLNALPVVLPLAHTAVRASRIGGRRGRLGIDGLQGYLSHHEWMKGRGMPGSELGFDVIDQWDEIQSFRVSIQPKISTVLDGGMQGVLSLTGYFIVFWNDHRQPYQRELCKDIPCPLRN